MDEENLPTILCCLCGVEIQQNPSNMCVSCLKDNVDITEGINKALTIHSCRNCGRFLAPPWQDIQLESKELMALCLRKIVGLSKVKLVDASWIWTEPHSMRLKIKLTVQKEVMNGAVLQQPTIVEFTIRNQQCNKCQASFAAGAWHAVVQVRQRASHKRTFFFLEQILIRYNAHADAVNIVTFRDGMDFYFPERQHGVKFIDFLQSHVPVKLKYSRKLVSADHSANTANFKHNHIVEIAPVCKDDLLFLPKDLAKNLSNISRMVLVRNVGADIHVFDPFTCEKQDISAEKYWRYGFNSTMGSKDLIRFVVLSVDPLPQAAAKTVFTRPSAKQRGGHEKKMKLVECVVARERDFGVNDTQFTCISHLGNVLKEGDVVLGYDFSTATWKSHLTAEEEEDVLGKKDLPDVLLVRKHYPTRGERKWMLKQLEVDERNSNFNSGLSASAMDTEEGTAGGKAKHHHHGHKDSAKDEEKDAEEYEEFLQEIEADREMRKHINLYKKPKKTVKMKGETMNSDEYNTAQLLSGKDDSGAAVTSGAAKKSSKSNQASSSSNRDNSNDDNDETNDNDVDDENMVQLDELLDDLVVSEKVEEALSQLGSSGLKVIREDGTVVTSGTTGAGSAASASVAAGSTFDASKYANVQFKFT